MNERERGIRVEKLAAEKLDILKPLLQSFFFFSPLKPTLVFSLFLPLTYEGSVNGNTSGEQSKGGQEENKEKKGRTVRGRQAKIGSLIEDSSWSVSHRGWAELACSDFTFIHANINGGLLSDPVLRVSGERRGGRMEGDEERETDGWWVGDFFLLYICCSAFLKSYHVCLRVCTYVTACLCVGWLWSRPTVRQTPRHNHRLRASNIGNDDGHFIDLVREQRKSLDVPQRAAWLEVTSLLLA